MNLLAYCFRPSCHKRCQFLRLALSWCIVMLAVVSTRGQITNVRIGWCETYKLGRWTPIAVDMKLSAPMTGKLVISARDGEGIWYDITTADPLTLKPGQVTVTTYARLGINDQIQVRWIPDNGGAPLNYVREVTERPVTAWQQLVVSLGSDVSIAEAMQRLRREPDETVMGVHVSDPSTLPEQWYGYDGVDVLVITTSQLDWIRSLDDQRKSALHGWVEQGGRVLVSVAKQAEELSAADEFLSEWIPGPYQRNMMQSQTSSLEELADATQRLDLLAQDSVGRVEGILTPVFEVQDGVVATEEGFGRDRSAWVIRRAHGLGIVTLLLADLDQPPLDRWPARAQLVAKLVQGMLPGAPARRDSTSRDRGLQSQLGYFDLTGQLRAALDKFPGVRSVPFALVAGLAGVFVLLIGPVDYFLLRRLGLRMQLSWVTFPLLAMATCVGIFLCARQWKGTSVVVNEVHLVDMSLEASNIRGTSWTHIFTPRTDRVSLDLQPHAERLRGDSRVSGVLLSWQGLPGTGFGGMSAPTRYGAFLDPYEVSRKGTASDPRMEVRELSMPQWSSRAFSGAWWGQLGDGSQAGQLAVSREGVLTGTLRNPLDVTLRDCAVCFGRWYYELGKLGPGDEFSFDDVQNYDLRSRLTRRVIFDSTKEMNSPWDPTSDDIGRIMEMYMFHEAAGGREAYTNLLHRYDGGLDMSDMIQLHRAVAYGRTEDRVCSVEVGGVDASKVRQVRHVFYRLVIPVKEL